MKTIFLSIICLLFSVFSYSQEPGNPGGDHTPTVNIDGLLYKLSETTHTAMVANENSWEGELVIPEQVNYEGNSYVVNRIEWCAFDNCKTLTKVRIPKTVSDIRHYAQWEDCKNPFFGCTALESIEVDEGNPNMCSVDGVLFNKDMTRLFCYPAGARNETYIVPDGVTWLGMDAFARNPYLLSVKMPNSVTYMSGGVYSECVNLKTVRLSESLEYFPAYSFDRCESMKILDIPESVQGFGEGVFRWTHFEKIVIRGTFPYGLHYETFYLMDDATILYVQPSEIEKFKNLTTFHGTVLPLEEYTDVKPIELHQPSYSVFDLQGRRLDSQPTNKGIYIQNGKKVVIK